MLFPVLRDRQTACSHFFFDLLLYRIHTTAERNYSKNPVTHVAMFWQNLGLYNHRNCQLLLPTHFSIWTIFLKHENRRNCVAAFYKKSIENSSETLQTSEPFLYRRFTDAVRDYPISRIHNLYTMLHSVTIYLLRSAVRSSRYAKRNTLPCNIP